MLGPDSGIGSVRVVVARRAVSLLSNRIFGAWITWTRNLCCGTISRLWTKNSLIRFCSGECPLAVVRLHGLKLFVLGKGRTDKAAIAEWQDSLLVKQELGINASL